MTQSFYANPFRSGLGLLGTRYTDDKARGNAITIVVSGMTLGMIMGPVYGGVMYQYTGMEPTLFYLRLSHFLRRVKFNF